MSANRSSFEGSPTFKSKHRAELLKFRWGCNSRMDRHMTRSIHDQGGKVRLRVQTELMGRFNIIERWL
jgi:hypothetical protein